MVTPNKRSQNEFVATAPEASLSPGEQLRQAREANGATLQVIAARTRISETTLYHLENDMYDEFAVEIFLKGHLRSYARELGLEPDDIIHSYEAFIGLVPHIEGGEADSGELSDSTIQGEAISTLEMRRSNLSLEDRLSAKSQSVAAQKCRTSRELRISSNVVNSKNRKVIARFDSQKRCSNVRRGPNGSGAGRHSSIRLTKPLFSLAERIFVQPSADDLSTSEVSAPIIRQRLNGSLSDGSPTSNPLRRSAPVYRNETHVLPQKSKIERAIPQLKQFVAHHYLAIIIVLVLSVITAGLLSGNRATAQDPAKFPKNSQDSWELERQADQTRWLLEQPDGQSDSTITTTN